MSDGARIASLAILACAGALVVPVGWSLSQPEQPAQPDRAQVLQAHLRQAPNDARGWVTLARAHMDAQRFAEAAEAYEKALAASPKVARDPRVWCELGDALGMAQGRRLAGRPRQAVEHAFALDPQAPCALEMAGSAAYEAGEDGLALAFWEPLLAQLTPGTQAHRELSFAIARTRARLATRPR